MMSLLSRIGIGVLVLLSAIGQAAASGAGQSSGRAPAPEDGRLSVQGLASFGVTVPSPSESFEVAGVGTRSRELGGAVQLTHLWRSLFVQANGSHWSDTGERSFVDSRGVRYPLGIPLTVDVTAFDIGAGWRFDRSRGERAPARVVPYAGAGAGVARYSERSPFAQPGDDVETTKLSYHGFGGVELGLTRWLAAVVDLRFRIVPDLFEGGLAGAAGDRSFGGTSATVRLMVGPRGWPGRRPGRRDDVERRDPSQPGRAAGSVSPPTPVPRSPVPTEQARQPVGSAAAARVLVGETVTVRTATPVFVVPNASRTPLRILDRGITVRVREDRGEWLLVEFRDPRWGPRSGYVLRECCAP